MAWSPVTFADYGTAMPDGLTPPTPVDGSGAPHFACPCCGRERPAFAIIDTRAVAAHDCDWGCDGCLTALWREGDLS